MYVVTCNLEPNTEQYFDRYKTEDVIIVIVITKFESKVQVISWLKLLHSVFRILRRLNRFLICYVTHLYSRLLTKKITPLSIPRD